MKRARLTPRDGLPELESSAMKAWRIGFFEGAAVWTVIGVAIGVLLAKGMA